MAATSCIVAVSATTVSAAASPSTDSCPAAHCAVAVARQRLTTTAGPSNTTAPSKGDACDMPVGVCSWGAGCVGVVVLGRHMYKPLTAHVAVPGIMSTCSS